MGLYYKNSCREFGSYILCILRNLGNAYGTYKPCDWLNKCECSGFKPRFHRNQKIPSILYILNPYLFLTVSGLKFAVRYFATVYKSAYI